MGRYKLGNDTRNHYAFHWDYLSECTDEQMYWLGWLATDGCVYLTKDGYYGIYLGLQKLDESIIQRFKFFIGAKSPSNYQVQMCSNIMAHRLISLGITERKSYTLTVHFHLADDAIFWRGAFEGDGSLSWNKGGYWQFSLCSSSYKFLQQWCNFINIPETYIYKCTANTWVFMINKQSELKKILITLYHQPDIKLRLERKWLLVNQALNSLK